MTQIKTIGTIFIIISVQILEVAVSSHVELCEVAIVLAIEQLKVSGGLQTRESKIALSLLRAGVTIIDTIISTLVDASQASVRDINLLEVGVVVQRQRGEVGLVVGLGDNQVGGNRRQHTQRGHRSP